MANMAFATLAGSLVASSGSSGSNGVIDWMGFVLVAVVTLVGASFVVTMYSLGIRLGAVSADPLAPSNGVARFGSYVCYAFSVLAVLVGIVLIVPPFYKFAMSLIGVAV